MVADARDWLEALTAAWQAERMAVRARVALERSGRILNERVALGIAIDRLRIVDEQSAPGERVREGQSIRTEAAASTPPALYATRGPGTFRSTKLGPKGRRRISTW